MAEINVTAPLSAADGQLVLGQHFCRSMHYVGLSGAVDSLTNDVFKLARVESALAPLRMGLVAAAYWEEFLSLFGRQIARVDENITCTHIFDAGLRARPVRAGKH